MSNIFLWDKLIDVISEIARGIEISRSSVENTAVPGHPYANGPYRRISNLSIKTFLSGARLFSS
jgi:hypothetical protein